MTVAATLIACSWKVLAKPGQPVAEDLACGFELSVAAIAMSIGFLPGSDAVGLQWGFVAAFFVLPLFMAVVLRFFGYVEVDSEDDGRQEWKMRGKAAVWNSFVGGMALMASWFLSVYSSELIKVWKNL